MKRFIILLSILAFLFNCEENTKSKNILPECIIVSPADSSLFKKGEMISVNILATDEDGKIKSVEFYINEEIKNTSDTLPCQFIWDTFNTELDDYKIKVAAIDNDNGTTEDEITLYIIKENSPPNVNVKITPQLGTIFTEFTFDASGTTDDYDNIDDLKFRWNFGDGIDWTEFFNNETIQYQFSNPGKYVVQVEVQDSDGATVAYIDTIRVDDHITDIDGNIYRIVKIGDQWWMAENLQVTRYRNGDPLIHSINQYFKEGAYYYDDDKEENKEKYGCLYNRYAVKDERNLAPEGWHISTDADWKKLERYIGMSEEEVVKFQNRGTDEGKKLKVSDEWDGTDNYGFSVLPSSWGEVENYSDEFGESYAVWVHSYGTFAFFYTTTFLSGKGYVYRSFWTDAEQIERYSTWNDAMSVRCVKDAE